MPKEFQILMDGKDSLSKEEQMTIQSSGPVVESHTDDTDMVTLDDFSFLGWDYEDRIRAYDHTINYNITWIGISGFGVVTDDIPFFRELLMYPVLVFASALLVFFTPAKLFYTLIGLLTFKISLWGYFAENWNTFVSVIDSFYMVFLSPWGILVDFFLLLPLDVIIWMGQVLSWFGINFPVLLYYLVYGFKVLYGRLYWVSLYLIYHFVEYKDSDGAGGSTVFAYFFWWAVILIWYLDYLTMTFGWSYWFNDVESVDF